jgi:trimeric autotransporter adhesin
LKIKELLALVAVVPLALLIGCTQPGTGGSAVLEVTQGSTVVKSGDTYDFGSAVVGTRSAAVAFTIMNSGTASASLTGSSPLSITGSASADFTVSAPSSTVLAAGSSTTFEVTWSPTTAAAETAQVSLSSDAGTFTLTLTGTGTTSGQLTMTYNGDGFMTLSNGGTVSFPALYGSGSTFLVFRIGNADASAPLVLAVGTPTITSGTGAFSITSRPYASVPHGGYTDFIIEFSWVGSGTYAETVTLKTSDPTTPTFTFTVTGDQLLG